MSATIDVNLLPYRKGADMSEVNSFAEEITRKASLEQLGYDITDPSGNPEKEFQSFDICNDALCWSDFSGCVKHLDVDVLIDQIVHRFPETEFIYRVFWNGPMSKEEYIKGDIREQLDSRILDVGIDNPEALQKVLKAMPGVKQSGPFLLFCFNHYPVSKLDAAVKETLQKLNQLIPDTPLYCVLGDEDEQGIIFSQKSTYSGGQITWQDLTDDERNTLFHNFDLRTNEPTDTLFEFLFKGLEIVIERPKQEEYDVNDDDDGLPL